MASAAPVILRLPAVKARSGLSRSTIYDPQTGFPKPVKLGARAVGWVEEEVDGWIRERIKAREATRAAR